MMAPPSEAHRTLAEELRAMSERLHEEAEQLLAASAKVDDDERVDDDGDDGDRA